MKESEELEPKVKTIWDVVRNILSEKHYDFKELRPENIFLLNRTIAKNYDCLFYANELNLYPDLEPKWVYDFYFYAIPAKKRFAKWFKHSTDEEVVTLLKQIYSVSTPVAESYLALLSEEQKNDLRKAKGGSNNK